MRKSPRTLAQLREQNKFMQVELEIAKRVQEKLYEYRTVLETKDRQIATLNAQIKVMRELRCPYCGRKKEG